MEKELIVAIIACLGAITTLAGAITIYIKQKTENEKQRNRITEIEASREATKRERDAVEVELRDKVQKAEWEINRIKEDNRLLATKLDEQVKFTGMLNTEVAKILVKLDQVIDALKGLKEGKS